MPLWMCWWCESWAFLGPKKTAMGAIASEDFCYINHDLVARLKISSEVLNIVVQQEQQELQRREKAYRD